MDMTPLLHLVTAIEAWPLSAAIRASVRINAALEVVHLVAAAALAGSVLMLELRRLGLARALPLAPLARLAARIAATALVLAAASGVLLFVARVGDLALHPLFIAKIGLLGAAALLVRVGARRGTYLREDRDARVEAALSIAVWIGIIGASRLIAYW